MAYATSNPIKKISQMGASNSLWYYTDGDAIGTIDNADYFILSYRELKAGDVIIVNSGGSNAVIDTEPAPDIAAAPLSISIPEHATDPAPDNAEDSYTIFDAEQDSVPAPDTAATPRLNAIATIKNEPAPSTADAPCSINPATVTVEPVAERVIAPLSTSRVVPVKE